MNCGETPADSPSTGSKGGNDPGVVARSAGWQQGTIVPEFIHSLGDLPQISEVRRPGPFARAEIAAVTGGRKVRSMVSMPADDMRFSPEHLK